MTSNDIEKLSIVATLNDGNYIISTTSNRAVIDVVTSLCEFARVNKELFENVSLSELTNEKEEEWE